MIAYVEYKINKYSSDLLKYLLKMVDTYLGITL